MNADAHEQTSGVWPGRCSSAFIRGGWHAPAKLGRGGSPKRCAKPGSGSVSTQEHRDSFDTLHAPLRFGLGRVVPNRTADHIYRLPQVVQAGLKAAAFREPGGEGAVKTQSGNRNIATYGYLHSVYPKQGQAWAGLFFERRQVNLDRRLSLRCRRRPCCRLLSFLGRFLCHRYVPLGQETAKQRT